MFSLSLSLSLCLFIWLLLWNSNGNNSIFGEIAIIKWILTAFFLYQNSGLTNLKCECTAYTAHTTQHNRIIHLICNHKVIYFRPLNGHKSNFHIKTGAWKTIRGKPTWQRRRQSRQGTFAQLHAETLLHTPSCPRFLFTGRMNCESVRANETEPNSTGYNRLKRIDKIRSNNDFYDMMIHV